MQKYKNILLIALIFVTACAQKAQSPVQMEYAQWFSITADGRPVLLDPGGGPADTLAPASRFICMSSSYIGFLDAIGATDAAVGVSGADFLGNPEVKAREVGYDAALDYETIVSLQPDLFLTYSVSGAEPPSLAKLRELGIRVAVLSEHLESHPLARAEYVKLFGALCGHQAQADSVFATVRDRYLDLVQPQVHAKVLINISYADQWFIPGGDNYMTRLVRDAGGELLGAVPGRQSSSVIDLETAFNYAQEADIWLHPGWCRTRAQLRAVHPLFHDFPVLEKEVWNNTLQTTPGGGNRFWETGPVHPDWVLEDLVNIFTSTPAPMHYYLRVE